MGKSETLVGRLKAKYHFGNVYLTYIPLNDMRYLLNEERKVGELRTNESFGDVLEKVRAFLNSTREQSMKEALAFVELNLTTSEAGFKKMSDRDGVIHKIAWEEREVQRIAEFADEFLTRMAVSEERQSSIASGRVNVAQAWAYVEDMRKDPYIPAVRTAAVTRDFRLMVSNRPRDLESLRLADRGVYNAIEEFSTGYTNFLVELSQKEALEPLRAKGAEVTVAAKILETKYRDCLALVGDCWAQGHLKGSAAILADFEHLETRPDISYFEVFQNLTDGCAVPKIVTTEPMRQLIIEPGAVFGDIDSVLWRS